MPELPEVEIVRQSLDKKVKNKKVKKVIVRNRNLRFKVPKEFENFLKNQKIIKVNRYSKYLILSLSNNTYCLIHLGMSGTMHLVKNRQKNILTNTSFYNSLRLPKKHNHIELIFENFKIVYNDPRRFGFFEILENNNLLIKRLSHLGPEPFSKKFDLKYGTYSYLEDLDFSYRLRKDLIIYSKAKYSSNNIINRDPLMFGIKEIVNRHRFVKKFNFSLINFYFGF